MSLDETVARPLAKKIHEGHLQIAGSDERREIGEEPITLGRDPACHVVLDDPEVSAVHLEVSADERGIRIRDLGSANGTFVGDIRVSEAHVTSFQRARAGSSLIEIVPGAEHTVPLADTTSFGALVGGSASMRDLFERLSRTARTDLTVMVLGETGTGKELVARAIHDASPRAKAPFVVVDCAAIPRSLGEATLLGHEKGAFTGADRPRPSPFVEANGGTIFLDELGELPLEIQPNLLRVLAERRVKPVGSSRYHDVDVRVIAATRQNLLAQVNLGAFRSDLYFRLAQVRVEVPPLRARKEDIPVILQKVFADLGDDSAFSRVPLESLERLVQHDFPGNVRELKNAATVAHALAGDGPVDVAQYVQEALEGMGGPTVMPTPENSLGIEPYHEAKRVALEQFEKEYFERVVRVIPDNISEMSRLTGLSRLHIRKHLQRHGIAVARPGQRG
jgi:DNA-binding NtrC family response regulator